jgi:hypothetical protein
MTPGLAVEEAVVAVVAVVAHAAAEGVAAEHRAGLQ